jgi:tRNA-specific 2-thiouridylase
MKERVVIAMSGGVDSSVAAAILKKEGYEVIGLTMCFNLPDAPRKKPACCGIQGIEDARRVAHKLGIRHYVLNMQKALKDKVIDDFCSEYLNGRTPNPCVRCNQYLKFDILLKKALALGAECLATGHYARIATRSGGRKATSREYLLEKAKDKSKDQSYFLYRLTQNQLRHIFFPLGDYTKTQVRILARRFGLPVADKTASQEICFLPQIDYRGFLKAQLVNKISPGSIMDSQGRTLGQHKGIPFYTIGQRQGLGIALGHPVYIAKIDHKTNVITVGRKDEVEKREFLVSHPHFVLKPAKKKIALKVRIRYNHKEAAAEISPCGRKLRVCFKKPQFAITPGQSAVFYNRDIVVGGGIIDKVLN